MFSPAKMLPYSRKLNDTGRKRIEITSSIPAAKKTTSMSGRIQPVVSPFGAKSSRSMPLIPTSCSAQTIQQPKNTSAIASVMFRSAFAPRKNG